MTFWEYAQVGGHLLFGDSGTRFHYRTSDSLAKATMNYGQVKRKRQQISRGTFRSRRYGHVTHAHTYKNKGLHLGYSKTELKFRDNEVVAGAMTPAWTASNPSSFDCISGVGQGNGESNHLGRTMYIVSIHVKGQVIYNTGESDVGPVEDVIGRVCLVLDTDTNATEIIATEVMDAGQTQDTFAFRNLQHTSRIKVLADKMMVFRPINMNEGSINLFANGAIHKPFTFNYRFKKPIRVLFSGTGAAVSDIVDNSLSIVTCCTASGFLTVNYQSRLRFRDNL